LVRWPPQPKKWHYLFYGGLGDDDDDDDDVVIVADFSGANVVL
jgi:hypothetical protein